MTCPDSAVLAEPAPDARDGQAQLKHDAIGQTSVVMQAVTHIAPAVAVLFTVQFTASLAGIASPLTYVIAAVIIAMLGVTLAQLAERFPSAGGYFEYISQTLGRRLGFLASWLFLLYSPVVAAFNFPFMGVVLQDVLDSEYGVSIPWWPFLVVAALFVGWMSIRGVELSAKMLMLFGLGEIVIVAALALWGIADPGRGGVSFASFDPSNASSLQGLYLGVVFTIFAFTGWEAAAPLAEEARNPRRTIPRAIFASILILAVFVAFSAWGLLVGWGVDDVGGFVDSTENPGFVLAQGYWGDAWVLVVLALLNSMLAVGFATTNVSTRMWYAMARTGTLPSWFAEIDPRFGTPRNAIVAQTILTIGVGFLAAALLGQDQTFFFFGLMVTFALIPVYIAGNAGAFRHFSRRERSAFRPVIHALFPLLSSAALIWVAVKSLDPLPDEPFRYAPLVVAAWLVIGIGLAYAMGRRAVGGILEASRLESHTPAVSRKESR